MRLRFPLIVATMWNFTYSCCEIWKIS